ncbi:prolyl oligopeptidase family serine peptidase [Nonomuraea spiralis]|uniref:Prolyl oligopeptidase family serine peptidase n=1 Tax=Nonomuraea spiralis TaxID=46182 RepID=A0ABV5IV36_9ACTN|nr:prolyl oligopeptidase family serine peptidase [Nonomuraea spiralis]
MKCHSRRAPRPRCLPPSSRRRCPVAAAGRRDARVPPWQPAKLAARLQAASASGRPVLLRVEEHGGHGAGSTREQEHALLADVPAFLLHAFEASR